MTDTKLHLEAGMPVVSKSRLHTEKCDAETKLGFLCQRPYTHYAQTWLGTMMQVCKQHSHTGHNSELRRQGAIVKKSR